MSFMNKQLIAAFVCALLVTGCTSPALPLLTTPAPTAKSTMDHAQHASQMAASPSANATPIDSPVRGLSAQEVDDLLNGRGAGYAKMGEVNGYPGPRLVLDLKGKLTLTADQVTKITDAFTEMQVEAKAIGKQIVEKEERLSKHFASQQIDATDLQAALDDLAKLYAQYRGVHLKAHLRIRPLMTAEQVQRYDKLRGYTQ